jgi:hypothetical protein
LKTFQDVSALIDQGEGRFRAEIEDGWQQGRGAFGGLLLALMARAMERVEADPTRRLRTLSGELCGPVLPGPVTLEVATLRRGSSASYLDARLLQGSEVLARSSATFSAPRKVESTDVTPAAPRLEALVGLEPLPVEPPLGPAFARAFEYRSPGPHPYSGSDRAEALGTIRLQTPPARLDAPTLIAYADAWWPSWLATLETPRGAATVHFNAQLLVDPATLDAASALVHVGRVHAQRDGYLVELRELWQGTTLVALDQQTFAVLS